MTETEIAAYRAKVLRKNREEGIAQKRAEAEGWRKLDAEAAADRRRFDSEIAAFRAKAFRSKCEREKDSEARPEQAAIVRSTVIENVAAAVLAGARARDVSVERHVAVDLLPRLADDVESRVLLLSAVAFLASE